MYSWNKSLMNSEMCLWSFLSGHVLVPKKVGEYNGRRHFKKIAENKDEESLSIKIRLDS